MSMYIDKKTGRPFIQFDFEGQTYKKRLPAGTTKAEAAKLELKMKHDLFFEDHLPEEKPTVLWERFVEDVYLPHVNANQKPAALDRAVKLCKAAMPFFGGRAIKDIKPADVERFKALRMSTPTQHGKARMPATIHREMSIISRIFNMAMKNDLCIYNPVSRVDLPKFDNIQDRILPFNLEERFLGSLYYLQRDICLTVLYTGLRQADVFALRKSQVNFADNEIRIRQHKTGRWVTIPLFPRLRTLFELRMQGEGDLIFPSYRTGAVLTSIRNSIVRASTNLGVRLTIRDLRRTFGTRLHENGYDDKTIADLLGHVGLRCVHRYKRGTEIKKKAILSLENLAESTKIPATGLNGHHADSSEPNKTLVEMRIYLRSALQAASNTQPVETSACNFFHPVQALLIMEDASKDKDESKAIGGRARAAKLSPADKSRIAKLGADARWNSNLPKATHEGMMKLGNLEVACAVLDTGQRVITQSDFMRALGRARQAKGRDYYDADVNMPAFLTAKNLKPFISKDLEVTSSQIEFRTLRGAKAFGYPAELLPKVCDVFMDAEEAEALHASQLHIAAKAKLLIRALAHVGVIALVDEATGYQEVRDRQALQEILDRFLRKELAAWAKRFPDEFYKQIFRLRGWEWKGMRINRPQVVASYTKDIVYERLAPGILAELEQRNPKGESGRRKNKHHQWLTEDVGDPALAQHLYAVIALMRAAKSWDDFKFMLNQALPKRGTTPLLNFTD